MHNLLKCFKLSNLEKIDCHTFIIELFSVISCFSQQLVATVEDAQKILDNQKLFIDKPLKALLKEIKPPIKRVTANPSSMPFHIRGYFIFNFVDEEESQSIKSKGKIPVTIVVYVKEFFDWKYHERPTCKETVWTADDEKKYENLTITGFRVYGTP